MNKIFAVSALALALGASAHSLASAEGRGQFGPMRGMMGGDCPTMGMMGQGMMGFGMGGPGWMGQGMGRGPGAEAHLARMESMVAGRLAYLRAELEITDAQRAAWDGYADAVRERVGVMQGVHGQMLEAAEKGGALERMDRRIQGMEAMLEAMKGVKPATAALYAVLSDAQKTVADDLIGAGCGAM